MMPFVENGVAVHFPDENYFFLSECKAYKRLSPFQVKEMDVCWLDKGSNTLWMVELKAFDHVDNVYFQKVDISRGDVVNYWINELFLKSIHTLSMLETNRSGTKECLVDGVKEDTSYKLVHLINVIPGQEEYLSFWQDKLKDLMLPYIKIYNISSVNILPYATAKKEKLVTWIV